jgi:serine/threonine protein kinase
MSKGTGKPQGGRGPRDEGSERHEGEGLATSDDLFGHLVDGPSPSEGSPPAPRRKPVKVQLADPVQPEPLAPKEADEELGGLVPPHGPVAEHAPFRPAPPMDDDEEARLPSAAIRTGAKLTITPPKIPMGPDLDLASVAESALEEEPGQDPRRDATAAPPPGRDRSWRDDSFGPYKLLDRVAVGGMAEVFKAKRAGVEGFEKVVALKRILPHLSENKEFLDMFVDEAKMVAGLTHPNIVQIFDLGRIESSYYIAMEYVHGRDLRTTIKRARDKGLRMPLDLSLRVVSQVCSALEYAHRKKDARGRPMEIVHRDVSPQNILITFEGDVKLADFGIAKAATKASTTDRGALRGKLLYMSPEQAWGRTIDRRSDVFSLGIVLYETVTEQKPFMASGSEMTILEMVRKCVITPPRDLNPRVPEALDRVIMKALARNPDERFQDAGQMQRGIEKILRERPPVTARDLARFLELLFDRKERDETGAEDHRDEENDEEESANPFSLDILLKRFGIDRGDGTDEPD